MKNNLYTILVLFLSTPLLVDATFSYNPPLVDVGFGADGGTIEDYLNFLYGLSISLAALLAVIKIVIAGAKWMLSDVVTDKGAAKKDIQNALFGLILILSAVLILQIINPDIVS